MTLLILGLITFLGLHSLRIVADDWRTRTVARMGEHTWRGLHSVLSLATLALVIWGYGAARQQPVVLWVPPRGMMHAAAALMVLSFILLAAAFVPGNGLRARMGHPMVLSVKTWAVAHLLANGNLADVLLFGGFLAWAVADFVSLRRRDRASGVVRAAGSAGATAMTVVAGLIAWAAFAFWLHGPLIGVRPLG